MGEIEEALAAELERQGFSVFRNERHEATIRAMITLIRQENEACAAVATDQAARLTNADSAPAVCRQVADTIRNRLKETPDA